MQLSYKMLHKSSKKVKNRKKIARHPNVLDSNALEIAINQKKVTKIKKDLDRNKGNPVTLTVRRTKKKH